MDNNPFTYVLTIAKLDATGNRWVASLSNYTFSTIYKSGEGHQEWCQAQDSDPAINKIVEEIQKGTLRKLKFKMEIPSELKVPIRIKKQLTLKQGDLYRRTTQADSRTRLQLVLPPSHRTKAITRCHDQVGHLGQDRVLLLLQDQVDWPRMYTDVASYINSCPRYLRGKSWSDQAPLLSIEASQPLKLIHLDYLKI